MCVCVGFDVSIMAHALGGIGRYVGGLASGLRQTAGSDGPDILTVDVPAAHPGVASPGVATAILRTPFYLALPLLRRIPIALGLEPASRERRLGSIADFGIYHHSGVQPAFPRRSISVITSYDTSALEHPEWHTADTVRYARTELELVRSGSKVVAISGWSASRACSLMGLRREDVFVTGGAADDSFCPGEPDSNILGRLGLECGRFILYVGNFVPNKNIPFLLQAYAGARGAGLRLPLVLAGAGGWRRPSLEGEGLVVAEAVSDTILLALYRGASALVLPSLFEGLGLPLLEAFACGCGVICSNSSALPETAAGHAILVDPTDEPGWRGYLLRLQAQSFSRELSDMALLHPRNTWRMVATALRSHYADLAG
jgi:glycosyltransferase involved in cell wall biosynthesis